MSSIAFDPYSDAQRDDPYPAYAEARRHSPVTKLPNGDYAVARYEDVSYVLRHPELFSSTAMMRAMTNVFGTAEGAAKLTPSDLARIAQLMERMPKLGEMMTARNMIASDPPVHGPMRNLVNRGFTPRRMAQLETRVREIARTSLAELERKAEFDIVHDFFVPLPVTVIAELLGVERERKEDFKHWSDCAVAGATGGAGAMGPVDVVEGFTGLSQYLTGIVEKRRSDPQDDLISTLIRAEDGETTLTPLEVVMFVSVLLVAGNETTTNLLGNTLIALMEHPEELARVRRDPGRIPAVVEEGLRYDGPIQFLFREARQDVELAGVKIPKGAMVLPLLGSANRDESQFAHADRFDPSRNTQGHLAFGLGIHFCLGASLARLEARIALEELLPRFAAFERTEPTVKYVDSYLVRGPKRLPLRVEAAA